jgi:hypothetical protein
MSKENAKMMDFVGFLISLELITIADWLISETPASLIDRRRNVNYSNQLKFVKISY